MPLIHRRTPTRPAFLAVAIAAEPSSTWTGATVECDGSPPALPYLFASWSPLRTSKCMLRERGSFKDARDMERYCLTGYELRDSNPESAGEPRGRRSPLA